jgi:hypothetical protein
MFKVTKIVNFAQPNFMSESDGATLRTLAVIRIVDISDPVFEAFMGYIHIGHQITLLPKNHYCFENKMDVAAQSPNTNASTNTNESANKESKEKQPSGSKKATTKQTSNQSTEEKSSKEGGSKLGPHKIENYLKNIKLKLKSQPQAIPPKDMKQYQ